MRPEQDHTRARRGAGQPTADLTDLLLIEHPHTVPALTQALVLLKRRVLVVASATRAWKINAAGRLMLTPQRGPARGRSSAADRTLAAVRWLRVSC
jgi:hypothetical protein